MPVMLDEWAFSPHADQRRLSMRLTRRDVVNTLTDFEREYPSSPAHDPDGRLRVRADGQIAVVFNPEDLTIVTVLWDGAIGRNDDGTPAVVDR